MPKITKKELEEAIAKGKSIPEIGKEYNVSHQRVSQLIREYQINRKKNLKKNYTIRVTEETYSLLTSKGRDWVRKQLELLAASSIEKDFSE